MSYQVLARKWRPQVFEDVVGQGHITRTLQNAITSGRLAHAFLFSGPRGVGKTTTARILAKALNCDQGPTPTPCGKCDPCIETTAGTSVDVIEIDGASNRGIEHIRELREAVKYAPVGGKYKVYVIDEVHMLTNEAFNALLKTLEEPPPHVIFIFATTEPQKIPATIHSRCQRYGFKRVALHEIIERLRTIAAAEGITISDSGLAMLARAAEGSMRDSQSLLDQAVSYSGMEIKDDDLQATLGSVAQPALLQFTTGLLARDAAGLLKQIDALLEQGQDMRQFLAGAVEHVRNLLVVKVASDPGQIIELSMVDLDAIKKQAAEADVDRLLMLFDSLSKTLDDMRWSPHQRFTLEVGLMKASAIAPLQPLSEVLGRMKELEARLARGGSLPVKSPVAAHRISEGAAPYAASPKALVPPSRQVVALGSGEYGDLWGGVISALKSKKPGLASALAHSTITSMTDSELVIGVSGASFQVELVEKRESRMLLEEVVAGILSKKLSVKVQPLADAPKPEARAKSQKKAGPEEQDPAIQDVLRVFPKGEVIENDHSSD
ncbi:MAG: DNA polymerase III subunit gamma/tau [Nitrospiraceae bacterium]|nr:DNA polymerase III subunit gamma/tau [Nitrospiraceae bacterium]